MKFVRKDGINYFETSNHPFGKISETVFRKYIPPETGIPDIHQMRIVTEIYVNSKIGVIEVFKDFPQNCIIYQ